MFRRDVQQIKDILLRNLRDQGLETPLMQKRLVDSWPQVAGELIASYTLNTYIVNQTFFVHLSSPVLRADLSLRRQHYVQLLNAQAGGQVITDIRFC